MKIEKAITKILRGQFHLAHPLYVVKILTLSAGKKVEKILIKNIINYYEILLIEVSPEIFTTLGCNKLKIHLTVFRDNL
jgi:hypothetical protein